MATTMPPPSELQQRGSRARVGITVVILSDAMLVAAMMASALYLNALNVLGQYHPAAEHTPSVLLGLLLAALMVGAREMYWWGGRQLRGGDPAGFARSLQIAVGLVGVALLGQIAVISTLGFPSPLHAFGSMVVLLQAYHAVHLLIAGVLGAMIFARFRNGRLTDGHDYLVDVVGYWWLYVAVVAVLFWLVSWIASG